MNNQPRVHHFVPQFWIKKFRDSAGNLHGYSWDDDRIKERSAKAVMQKFDLYTIQPSGADDTTLETSELGDVDRNGSAAFERILAGDYSEPARVELANFFAAQVMRDPQTIASYKPKTQEYALALLGALDAADYGSFLASLRLRFPGADLKEPEYDYIRSLGPVCAEKEIEKIINALDAVGGLPELPFTDLVRESSGRDIIRAVLLSFDWEIKIDTNAGFVLGDTGILYNDGDLGSGLAAPLSDTTALYLKPAANPAQGITHKPAEPFEVQNLNLESAARTRRWLIGQPQQLAHLKSQLSSQGLPRA